MSAEPNWNKSTFIFSNIGDPDDPITFQTDDRDHELILRWLI